MNAFAEHRYIRQSILPFIGEPGQQRLGHARIGLLGCGALGSAIADLLVRAGVGHLTLIDRDYVELHNLQRQTLFDEADVAAHLPKAEAAAARLNRINSSTVVEPRVADFNADSARPLLAGSDILVDGTDNFDARYLLNDLAIETNRSWVYGGVIASYGMTMTIIPGVSPCLRCVFPDAPDAGTSPTCDTAGVFGPAVHLVASLQASEAIKLAVGDHESINRDLVAVDPWRLTFDRISLGVPSPHCPACGRQDFAFLETKMADSMTVLCGHDAVQVLPPRPTRLDLHELRQRLSAAGDVLLNPFLLRFTDRALGHELTVFPDGRAIVKGTTDATEARRMYSQYVGS